MQRVAAVVMLSGLVATTGFCAMRAPVSPAPTMPQPMATTPLPSTPHPPYRSDDSFSQRRLAPLEYPANPEGLHNGAMLSKTVVVRATLLLPGLTIRSLRGLRWAHVEKARRVRLFWIAPGRIVYEVTIVRGPDTAWRYVDAETGRGLLYAEHAVSGQDMFPHSHMAHPPRRAPLP